MRPFKYFNFDSIATIFGGFNRKKNDPVGGMEFLAGGTNLVDLMKKHVRQPDALLNLSGLLDERIETTGRGLRIGAMARNTAVATDPTVLEAYPLLAQAILSGASPQIRNMASTGGNLLQRTRCPYFYDTALPCNKREPGTGCGAFDGNNRIAAIVGYSENCVAVHPSDMSVALAALEAEVEISDNGNIQKIPFREFHRLPGDRPEQDTNLPPGAMITAIHLPPNNFQKNSHYLKLRERDSYAFALVSVAAALELRKGRIRQARLASGGVAHKPWRWYEAEDFLKRKKPSPEVFARAAEIVVSETRPLPDNGFKVALLRGGVETALQACVRG